MGRSIGYFRPIVLLIEIIVLHKVEVEKTVVIDQLVYFIFSLSSIRYSFNKTALVQIINHL